MTLRTSSLMTTAVVKITPLGVAALQSIYMYLRHVGAMRNSTGRQRCEEVGWTGSSPEGSSPEQGFSRHMDGLNVRFPGSCARAGGDGETCTRGRRNLLPRPPPP